jgi:hypothetical protein
MPCGKKRSQSAAAAPTATPPVACTATVTEVPTPASETAQAAPLAAGSSAAGSQTEVPRAALLQAGTSPVRPPPASLPPWSPVRTRAKKRRLEPQKPPHDKPDAIPQLDGANFSPPSSPTSPPPSPPPGAARGLLALTYVQPHVEEASGASSSPPPPPSPAPPDREDSSHSSQPLDWCEENESEESEYNMEGASMPAPPPSFKPPPTPPPMHWRLPKSPYYLICKSCLSNVHYIKYRHCRSCHEKYF